MKNYIVRIYVSECQEDTFSISAPDFDMAQRGAMIEAIERGYDIDDVIDIVEAVEAVGKPEIKRNSTWDYDNPDHTTDTVETIETWEWSEELGRYEMVYLEEKETGEYIPFNEIDYIQDGAVDIPR